MVEPLEVSEPSSSDDEEAGERGASYSQSSMMASSLATYSVMHSGDAGGVGGVVIVDMTGMVNREQAITLFRSSDRVMRCSGMGLKIRPRMSFSSSDKGRMVFRKSWLRAYAR